MNNQLRLAVLTLHDHPDVVAVTFRDLAGQYYLVRAYENFAAVLPVLQESARCGQRILVTLAGSEVIGAEATA